MAVRGDSELLTGPTLTVDLNALAHNYRLIRNRVEGGAETAGVVKADGYGLGVGPVVETLRAAGCRTYFVARLEEALAVRSLAPESTVYVFDGVLPGQESDLAAGDIRPVVNSLDQLHRWRRHGRETERRLPMALHVDTGMARLGLDGGEWRALVEHREWLSDVDLRLVLSHLASADDLSDQSDRQHTQFEKVRSHLSGVPASLANSAGVFLGHQYHFDLVRPGFALYGGHPQPERLEANPMLPVVGLKAPVVQVRRVETGDTVGYGATFRAPRPSRVATVGVGYADGFLRSGSDRSHVAVTGVTVPVVGRVSMDLITVDVTDLDPDTIHEGTPVDIIGPDRTVDAVAADAGTIGYEVLTALGRRFDRRYRYPSADREPSVPEGDT